MNSFSVKAFCGSRIKKLHLYNDKQGWDVAYKCYKCSDLLLAVYYFIQALRSKTDDELILHPYFSMHQCIFQQETGMGNVVHSPCRDVDERSGSMLHFVHDPEKVEMACSNFFT